MTHHGRRSCVRRCLTIAGAASMGALLLFAGGQTMGSPYSRFGIGAGTLQQQRLFPLSPPPEYLFTPPPEYLLTPPPEYLLTPPPEYLLTPPPQSSEAEISFARRLLPFRRQSRPLLEEDRDDQSAPQLQDDAVLLPDQEVLVLAAEPVSGKAICEFHGGASSPARPLGRLPGSGRHAYLCLMPDSAQPLQAPRLLPASAAAAPTAEFGMLLNWSNKLVFDAAMLPGGDVLMFAKGVNHRQGVQCIYHGSGGADGMVASFPAISSAQQVVRCSLVGAGRCCCRISVF